MAQPAGSRSVRALRRWRSALDAWADDAWIRGGRIDDLVSQISNPQHGNMPAWGERLEPEMVKMLTVYVHALGGGQ